MNSLHRTLDSLPKTLDETYGRILGKVNDYDQPFVQHILQCVCFFARPISIEELVHIYRIGDKRKPPFDSEGALFHPKDAIDLCGGLLCVDLVDAWKARRYASMPVQGIQVVQLAHFSVKEYLLSSRSMSWRLDEELSHRYIVKAGIAYYLEFMALGDITSPGASVKVFHMNHSLAVYCARFTPHHLSHINPRDHPDLTESFQYLLDPTLQPNLDRKLGLCHFYRKFSRSSNSKTMKAHPLEVSTLYIAVDFGLPMICNWLLSVNTLAQISSTLTEPGIDSAFLAEAVAHRHVDVLEVLLNAGANINKQWKSNWPPLHNAVRSGDREIVEMLINLGADVNLQSYAQAPVDLAIALKHEEIEKILRAAGGRPSK
jgi:hypothetical protein